MPKVKDYTVVYAGSLQEVWSEVRAKISEGWQPLGGIAVSLDERAFSIWAQAMVKYAEE